MYHTLYVASLSASGGGSASEARVRVLTMNSSGAGVGGGGSGMMTPGRGETSVAGSGSSQASTPKLKSGGSRGTNINNLSSAIRARDPDGDGGGFPQTYIPPILSCGSQSSMGSVKSASQSVADEMGSSGDIPSSVDGLGGAVGGGNVARQASQLLQQQQQQQKQRMKPARHSAKELPVWLISMFLLVHCEDQSFLRCTSGEDERRFSNADESPKSFGRPGTGDNNSLDFSTMLLHRTLSPRTRLHAGMHQNNANCASFLLRHLRKFLLLCAVPRNADACRAVAILAAQQSSVGQRGNERRASFLSPLLAELDIQQIEQQHEKEHRNIGLNVQLTLEELDRLNLVMQAPSGGPVEEPPIAIGEHVLRCIAIEEMETRESSGGKSNAASLRRMELMQDGLVTVEDAERVLRRYLEEEITMAQQELDGDDNDGAEDVSTKLSKMSLGTGESSRFQQPLSPPRSRGLSVAESIATDGDGTRDSNSYFKELSYRKLRSTTVLLETNKDSYGTPNNANYDTNSVVSLHSQTSSTHLQPPHHHASQADNECGRLHDLHIADCSDTTFYLLQPFEHATVAACTDCTIVIGAVAGLLHVVDCERTTITSAARRVVVSNSSDVVHYLFTPSPPLLVGDNRGCQFAPYNTYYEGLREDLLATGLAAALRSTVSSSSDRPASPSRGGGDGRSSPTLPPLPALQCASNKWKMPLELAKVEVPHLPNVPSTPGSPTPIEGSPTSGSHSPGADDRAFKSSVDLVMQTPVLLPPSDFEILLVPVESEEARVRRRLQRQAEEDTINEEEAAPFDGGEDTGTVYSNASSLTGERDRGEHASHRSDGPIESDYCRNLADILTLSPFHMPHDYERRVVAKAERVRALQQAIVQDLNDQQRANLQEELNRGFQDWLVASGNLRQVLDLVHLEKRVAA